MNTTDLAALLELAPDPLFQEIAGVAAHACEAPIALIALADDAGGRHKIVAAHGAASFDMLPGDDGLCCLVVESGAYLEVADAAFDVRFQHDALVTSHGIRFYAGVPLTDPAGLVVGVLCVMDLRPGVLDDARRLALERIAHTVVRLLESRLADRARKAAEESLFQEKELAQITLESIGDAMITADALGCITYLNPVAERLTGWSSREALGIAAEEVFRILHEDDRRPAACPVERVLREGVITGLASNVCLVSRTGHEFSVEDSAAPIRDRAGRLVGVVLVFRDVSHARELAQSLTWQASHDALTDLVNRREFERLAVRLLERSRVTTHPHAILYIDLDQFKVVNDTCGHLAGDALLRQLAGLLPVALRKSDTLARLGGDEFGVLLEGCDIAQASRIAEQLLAAIRAFRFQWDGRIFSVSASIGVAAMNSLTPDLENALAAADTACFLAKDKGRNQVQVFRLEDEEVSSRRGELGWASRLAQCLEEERFFLLCQRVQPLCCVESSEPEYLELLLRMRDENGATIAPMAFIPAAERYNLMPGIDRWVIRRTLSCLQHLALEGRESSLPRFAINLSGMSLSDAGLLDFILGELDRTGVEPASLCFEVTETAAVANLARAVRLMQRLRQMGCRFALDDFGSGLSSFSYLKNLPVDYLKIDGSFIRTIAEDGVNLAMVEAIRRVGEVMGIRTIAECVENRAVLERVRAVGIDFAQGHHIHAPESYQAWRAKERIAA